jgi:hypothetical protein
VSGPAAEGRAYMAAGCFEAIVVDPRVPLWSGVEGEFDSHTRMRGGEATGLHRAYVYVSNYWRRRVRAVCFPATLRPSSSGDR